MIYRILTKRITDDLAFFPVVGIVGPRQAGKTTLAQNLLIPGKKPVLYLDLEWDEDRAKLADAGAYLLQHEEKCVIIDEVQIMPQLFGILRSLVDKKREPARFILLGSASPELLRNSAESLAGRIAYHELTPCDSGFYHAVTRLRDREDLYANPAVGASWEGYVIEQIYRIAGKQCEYYYYRTSAGAEVDLLLLTPRLGKICIEIKYANAPKISRGFYNCIEDLNPERSYVITPDSESYQRTDGIRIVNIYDFLTVELPGMIG
jgi:predicted AAA+ superfamily ATPase